MCPFHPIALEQCSSTSFYQSGVCYIKLLIIPENIEIVADSWVCFMYTKVWLSGKGNEATETTNFEIFL